MVVTETTYCNLILINAICWWCEKGQVRSYFKCGTLTENGISALRVITRDSAVSTYQWNYYATVSWLNAAAKVHKNRTNTSIRLNRSFSLASELLINRCLLLRPITAAISVCVEGVCLQYGVFHRCVCVWYTYKTQYPTQLRHREVKPDWDMAVLLLASCLALVASALGE